MARSNASTPEEYLSELPDMRREVVARVREVILENLPLHVIGTIAGELEVDALIEGVESLRKKG